VNGDRVRRRVAAVLLPAVACLLAAVGGWLMTALPELPRGTDDAVEWRLPLPATPEAANASQVLAGRNIWDATAAAPGVPTGPAQPLTPPDWRIMAAVIAGKDRSALIRVGSEPPYELRIGDKLPGGAIIRGIEADRLIIELNGKRRILRLSAP
jgi:hypothetical protein